MTFDPLNLAVPDGYNGWLANAKAEWLWDRLIMGTAYDTTTLPALRLPFQAQPIKEIGVVVRRDELAQVFHRDDDLMEAGRPKVIHAFGSVAQVSFEVDASSPFTGLFAAGDRGGAIGLLRMSLVARVKRAAAFTPGFGLKLLVDKQSSADLLAMNHTVGQGRDFNVFSNTMTNDLSDEHKELRPPQKAMGVLFNRVSENPRRLVLSHFVDRHRDGSKVEEPAMPRRLVFRPSVDAKHSFSGQAGVDFRRVLATIEPGTVLYDVVGLTGPAGSLDSVPVGKVRVTAPFTASAGGERLFFRHMQDSGDLKR